MPIRPEQRGLYPADWPEISRRIRERAGNKCEWCGVENGDRGIRNHYGEWLSAKEVDIVNRKIRIVLTVAHLNHDPSDCRDENLKALCQQCHNRHDAPMRRAGIRHRQAERAGQMKLEI